MLYNAGRFLSIIPPATGIFVGDGVRGDVLSFSPRSGEGDGELPLRVACAIKDFKSERELRLFFLSDWAVSFSSGGGDSPIVMSLLTGPCELEGRSSKAPITVGRSREAGRLCGDSIDLERLRETFERLEEVMDSPVAILRLLLLKVRQTEGRSLSLVLFCLSKVSANLFRKDDAFDVSEPVAE